MAVDLDSHHLFHFSIVHYCYYSVLNRPLFRILERGCREHMNTGIIARSWTMLRAVPVAAVSSMLDKRFR